MNPPQGNFSSGIFPHLLKHHDEVVDDDHEEVVVVDDDSRCDSDDMVEDVCGGG